MPLNDLPALTPANLRDVIPAIEQEFARHKTLDIPRRASGLYAASSRPAATDASGYQHAWVRDTMMVAYSQWHGGEAASALATVRSVQACLRTQLARMTAIIDHPALKERVQERPHVRFVADTGAEVGGSWAHAQNDALGYAMWMRLRLADVEALDSTECETVDVLAQYCGAIEYWSDQDSGAWEEARKVNASSIGAVVAALTLLRDYRRSAGTFGGVNDRDLDRWIASGRAALAKSLPFESPPARRTDAALLFLIHPLSVVEDRRTEDMMLSLVRARLVGEVGIRRYVGDSYFCQDYDEWFPPAERTMDFSSQVGLRDELLRPGCEAQWCLFDPILSSIYAARFRRDPRRTDLLRAQLRHFSRALEQLTSDGQAPELYYLKGDTWIPNEHVPLAWTQANLAVALRALKQSAEVLRSAA
ncbi:MAG: phosphorylase kinase [Acidobacteria bacterium]|nr:MAG: phosphorylase kinase [Acidobacteriota bacterium]